MDLGRRDVLGSGLTLLAGRAATAAANAQELNTYGAAPTGLGITSALARFLSGIRYEDLSPAAVHEAKRAVLDWIGCALAGSAHPTVSVLLATFEELGSVPVATVLGGADQAQPAGCRGERSDGPRARLRRHAPRERDSSPLPPPFQVLALGEWRKSTGRDLIVAWPRPSKGAFGWDRPPRVTTSAAGI